MIDEIDVMRYVKTKRSAINIKAVEYGKAETLPAAALQSSEYMFDGLISTAHKGELTDRSSCLYGGEGGSFQYTYTSAQRFIPGDPPKLAIAVCLMPQGSRDSDTYL